jgi:hypothetical protein
MRYLNMICKKMAPTQIQGLIGHVQVDAILIIID